MLEQYGLYLLAAGAVLALLSFVLLVRAGFKLRRLWGFGMLFFPPVAAVFVVRHFRQARGALLVGLLAALVLATPYALSYYERHFVKLAPYEQMVDGERRITLTGLADFDYATLQDKRDTVVLQMANADVSDQTLEYLRGMNRLRKLDLSGTRITDEGLRVLADLPGLQELYLARTAITDEGFRKYLAPREGLLKLDLTGTQVKGKTKRDWKKHKPDEREFVD
jgi:hypothetical protein